MIKTNVNCETSVKGTGMRGCRVKKEYINRRFLIEKGYKFDAKTDTLNMTKVSELIQKGVLVPLPTNLGAEPKHSEATYETIQKQDIFISDGVYGWVLKYEADKCLAVALESLSNKKWDLLEVDESGNLNMAVTSNGYLKGFDTHLVKFENMEDNDGSKGAKLSLKIQLTPRGSKEYQSSWTKVYTDEVDWSSLEGVDEIELIPISKTQFKAVFSCDQSTPVEGLETAHFRVLDNRGQVVNGATFTSDGDGVYTIAGLTTSRDYRISTYDTAKKTTAVVMANYFYKSNVMNFTA